MVSCRLGGVMNAAQVGSNAPSTMLQEKRCPMHGDGAPHRPGRGHTVEFKGQADKCLDVYPSVASKRKQSNYDSLNDKLELPQHTWHG